jgi:phosphomannomutase
MDCRSRRKIRAVTDPESPSPSTPDPTAAATPAALGVLPEMHAEIVRWLTEPTYAALRAELRALVTRAEQGDPAARAELQDAFAGPLPIGTGGRRGAVGPGPNRVNAVVLRQTAQGLVQAMRDEGVPMRVAVAFDTRRDSRAFAHVVAQQLASNGVEVLLIDAARPTPQLSFTVRARGCGAGIVISASHNPPGDNGIKIYGPDGAQVLGARDTALMEAIERAMAAPLPAIDAQQGATARITCLPLDEVDAAYHAFVRAQGVAPAERLRGSGLAVVFTPLHGVGHTAVVPALADTGIVLHLVERQCDPDGGNFSTVQSANPEAPSSMDMARALADERGAALVIATDPDADRLGALVRNRQGTLEFLDGNRMAVVMFDHVLRHAPRPANAFVLTTIVTTALVPIMARAAGLEVVDDLLVGFKHHAGMMAERPDDTVFFGCEESHGFMRGDAVHDKDGAVAARLLVEAAALAHGEGLVLFDVLERVWREHGYHRERTENLYAYGAAGREAIAGLMRTLRAEPPTHLGGLAVVGIDDRLRPRNTGSPTRDLLGNVLTYDLEGQAEGERVRCRLTVRPSGTEPKAKVYALAGSDGGLSAAGLVAAVRRIDGVVDAVLAEAKALADGIMAPMLGS